MDKKVKDIVKLMPYQVREEMTDLNAIIPYGVDLVGAPDLWQIGNKGEGVTIAIIDTGCDIYHINLEDRIIGGRNFTDEDNGNPNIFLDYNGHGTHVAGILAASENSGGVVGVAPKANLLILKALNGEGSGDVRWITNAINYATTQNVDIISMSLGGTEYITQMHEAIKKAVKNDILVVCAAGNEGDNNPLTEEYGYPAAYNEVISVGAVDQELKPAYFSNSNKQIDVVAPGVGIISTFPGNRYAKLDGTSMSTPHISGALALLINWSQGEFQRDLSESELYAQLIKSTLNINVDRTLQGNGFVYLGEESSREKGKKNKDKKTKTNKVKTKTKEKKEKKEKIKKGKSKSEDKNKNKVEIVNMNIW